MSIVRCEHCQKNIDTDTDAEHFTNEDFTECEAMETLRRQIQKEMTPTEKALTYMLDSKHKVIQDLEKEEKELAEKDFAFIEEVLDNLNEDNFSCQEVGKQMLMDWKAELKHKLDA